MPAADISPEARFADLGGDSLSALTFSRCSTTSSASKFRWVWSSTRPEICLHRRPRRTPSRRGRPATHVRVGARSRERPRCTPRTSTLDKFIDDDVLKSATCCRNPPVGIAHRAAHRRDRLSRAVPRNGVARGTRRFGRHPDLPDAGRRRRRRPGAHRGGVELRCRIAGRFRALADEHLDVLAGDIGEPNLGLDDATWQRLADTVDLIVHPAAT